MQSLTGGQQRVQVAGRTVRQVINNLDELFPGVKDVLYDAEEDDLQTGVAVIVDGEASQIGLLERVKGRQRGPFSASNRGRNRITRRNRSGPIVTDEYAVDQKSNGPGVTLGPSLLVFGLEFLGD